MLVVEWADVNLAWVKVTGQHLLSGLFLVMSCDLFAQQKPAADDPAQVLAIGQALQQKGEASPSAFEATQYLQQAIEQYTKVIQLKPDYYPGHLLWSYCLLALAQRDTYVPQRRADVQAALERFAAASRCPGVDWAVYKDWGGALATRVGVLATSKGERRLILDQARKSSETALSLAQFSGQRATIGHDLGACLLLIAETSDDVAEKREIYRQAATLFNSASTLKSDLARASVYKMWGISLGRLGKLDSDPALFRESANRLESAAELDPANTEIRYNLACIYALLDMTETALRHLRFCLDNDPQRKFFKACQDDPDLKSVRATTEGKGLLRERGTLLDADKLFAAGLNFQKYADEAPVPDDKVQWLEKAAEQFSQATRSKPDFYRAHTALARCQFRIARQTADLQRRQELFKSAEERCAVAASCKEVDWSMSYLWGVTLTRGVGELAAGIEERRRILTIARQAFGAALAATKTSGDRAKVEHDLSACLMVLAEVRRDLQEKQALYRETIVHLESATKLDPYLATASIHKMSGIALGQLAKLTNDRVMFRQAAERLETAAKEAPNIAETRYNLACIYALLEQPEAAIRNLRLCLENDPDGQIARDAVTDPDLKSLRGRPGFDEVLRKPNTNPTGFNQQPKIPAR